MAWIRTAFLGFQEAKPFSSYQAAEYAAREAATPHLGAFEGGAGAVGLWLTIALLSAVVVLIYLILVEPGRFGGR